MENRSNQLLAMSSQKSVFKQTLFTLEIKLTIVLYSKKYLESKSFSFLVLLDICINYVKGDMSS